MNKINSEIKEFYTKPISHCHFSDPNVKRRQKIYTPIVEADLLLQGKLTNHLYLKTLTEQPAIEISHPYFKKSNEKYQNFITKISEYPLEVNEECIESILRKNKKSIYQTEFCRPKDGIFSKKTEFRNSIKSSFKIPSNWQPIPETTKQFHYRSPIKIAEVGTILPTVSYRPSNKPDPLVEAFKKIFKFGRTVYKIEISDLADGQKNQKIRYNTNLKIKDGPIDRFSKLI